MGGEAGKKRKQTNGFSTQQWKALRKSVNGKIEGYFGNNKNFVNETLQLPAQAEIRSGYCAASDFS